MRHGEGLFHRCARWTDRLLPCPFDRMDELEEEEEEETGANEKERAVAVEERLTQKAADVSLAVGLPAQLMVRARGKSLQQIEQETRGLVEDAGMITRPRSVAREQTSGLRSTEPLLNMLPSVPLPVPLPPPVISGLSQLARAAEMQLAEAFSPGKERSLDVGQISGEEAQDFVDARANVFSSDVVGEGGVRQFWAMAMIAALVTTLAHGRAVLNMPATELNRMRRFRTRGGILFPGARGGGGIFAFDNNARMLRLFGAGGRRRVEEFLLKEP